MDKYSIGIIGVGAWGIAIANICADNGYEVKVWSHDSKLADEINNRHVHMSLPGVVLNSFFVGCDLDEIVSSVDILVIAVSSSYIKILENINIDKPILILTKGLMENGTSLFIHEYIHELMGENAKLAILSGPNIAFEIANKLPAASVACSYDQKIAELFQNILSNNYFRVYTNSDLIGVALGGILKNVIAIAGGICDGLQLGSNSKSTLITRGLQEMIRFGIAFGANKNTFFGLSGLGDLVTTCVSSYSRNWKTGYAIGKEGVWPELMAGSMNVAEGIRTSKIIRKIAQEKNIELPIIEEVYQVLYHKKDPQKAISSLMLRDLKSEV